MFEDSKLAKFISGSLVFLIIVYFICQSLALADVKLQTENATMLSVDDCILTSGYFVRNETVVKGKEQGAVVLAINSGEKIAKDSTIAVYYDSNSDADISRQIDELDNQIVDCNYVISQAINKPDTAKLDSAVITLNANIATSTKDGFVAQSKDYISEIRSTVIRRGLIYSDTQAVENKLAALKAQKKELSARLTGHKTEVKSTVSGYFSTDVDGYENLLNVKALATLTGEQFNNLANIPEQTYERDIGRISTEFEWYFAVSLNKDQASKIIDRFASVKKLNMKIHSVGQQANVSLHSTRELENGNVLIVFIGTEINDELLKTRYSDVEIVIKTYTGIKIPKEALRHVDEKWGVYCTSGQRLIFKEVNIIFEADTYYIAQSDGLSSKEVYIYDEIVISGKELSKNQVIE